MTAPTAQYYSQPAMYSSVPFLLGLLVMWPSLSLLSGCSQSPSAKDAAHAKTPTTAKTNNTDTPDSINKTNNTATSGKDNPLSTTPIRIAAAANLANVLPKIIATYQVDNANATTASTNAAPIKIDVTYASSGKLYAQIIAGAPYDIFLSANQDYPLKLAKTQLVADGSQPFTYARGQLAWYSTLHPIQPTIFSLPSHTASPTQTLSTLLDSVQKISIANPQLAPYGASAQRYLQQLGVYDELQQQGQLIQAENIGQAFQYVHSGSVDYGLVAVTQLIATHAKPSQYHTLAPNRYPPILQDGIVLNGKASNNSALNGSALNNNSLNNNSLNNIQAASDFATYLQSPAAQQQFVEAGYLAVSQ